MHHLSRSAPRPGTRLSAVVVAFLAIAAASAAGAVWLGADPAGALSCAPHPDASPERIATGTERLASDGGFFDRFDLAVIGTVTAVDTEETAGPAHGATRVTVAVEGVLGAWEAPAEMVLSAADPGWMAGYPFRVGTRYFVPVQSEGPDGQENHTFVCDPVHEVDELAATDLVRLATATRIPAALVGPDVPGTGAARTPEDRRAGGRPPPPWPRSAWQRWPRWPPAPGSDRSGAGPGRPRAEPGPWCRCTSAPTADGDGGSGRGPDPDALGLAGDLAGGDEAGGHGDLPAVDAGHLGFVADRHQDRGRPAVADGQGPGEHGAVDGSAHRPAQRHVEAGSDEAAVDPPRRALVDGAVGDVDVGPTLPGAHHQRRGERVGRAGEGVDRHAVGDGAVTVGSGAVQTSDGPLEIGGHLGEGLRRCPATHQPLHEVPGGSGRADPGIVCGPGVVLFGHGPSLPAAVGSARPRRPPPSVRADHGGGCEAPVMGWRATWDERHREATSTTPDPPIGWAGSGATLGSAVRVLDVACGTGAVAVWAALEGHTVTAIDGSPVAVDRVRALAGAHGVDDRVDARVHDLDDGLPTGLGLFDLVVCQRYRDPNLVPALLDAVGPEGYVVLTVLSAVGAAEPGRFHAPAGELDAALADEAFDVLVSREGSGLATVVARRHPVRAGQGPPGRGQRRQTGEVDPQLR